MGSVNGLRPPTPEEARERGRKGGLAKRRKANLRKAMQDLLTSPGPTLEGEEITYEEALALAMINEALGGGKNNVAAYNAIMQTLRVDDEAAERRARIAKVKAETEEVKRRLAMEREGGEAAVVIIDDIPDTPEDQQAAGTATAVFDALGQSSRPEGQGE